MREVKMFLLVTVFFVGILSAQGAPLIHTDWDAGTGDTVLFIGDPTKTSAK